MSDSTLIHAQVRAHANAAGALPHTFAVRSGEAGTPAVPGTAHFMSVFDTNVAHGLRQRLACHRVRFQTYCVDNKFETAQDHPDGFETDAYDEHSIHSVLMHRSANNPIGTVRLVLPHGAGRRRALPIQTLTPLADDAVAPFPIDSTGELSRFAILKSFHRHVPDGVDAELSSDAWKSILLCLPLGLIRASIEMLAQEGRTHVVAVMEPALLRHLARFGVHFNPLGGLVEHHGQRQPCWADVGVQLARSHAERPDVWALVTDHGRLWPAPLSASALGTTVAARSEIAGMHA